MSVSDQTTSVLVIGAGIVGLSAALQLQLDGYKVMLVDKQAPMNGCSAGNAGCLSQANIFPPVMPDIVSDLPKLLLSRNSPLVIRPAYLPTMLPWLRSAARMRHPQAYNRIIATMGALTIRAISSFDTLLAASGASDLISHQGLLVAFRTLAAMQDRERRMQFWHNAGIQVSKLDTARTLDLAPALSRDIVGSLFFSQSGHCSEPRELGMKYAQRLMRHGTQIIRANVSSIGLTSERSAIARTEAGAHLTADNIVLCGGYESKALLEQLDYKVPLAAERGYHLMLPAPNITMRLPVIFGEPYFAATPMIDGLRLAGTAEFARFNSPPNFKRATMLLEQARQYLPDIGASGTRSWSGTRPSFADGMPAIGSLDRHPRIFYAFGHGHNGLTLSAVTAKCVSALVSGKQPPVPLENLSLQRLQ